VRRVMHAVAVETTTHPVAGRHVKNNMALALLSSHCSPVVHELPARLAERISFAAALRIGGDTRQRGRSGLQNRTYGYRPASRRPRGSQ
jgi:hypothetical protein